MSQNVDASKIMHHSKKEKKGSKKTDDKKDTSEPLAIEDIFKVVDLFYKRKNVMYWHLYNSFDKFIDEDIKNFLLRGDNTFYEKITVDSVIKYKFEFDNISIRPPLLDTDGELMFPSDARNRSLTYAAKLMATVTQVQEVTNIVTDKVTRMVIGTPEHNVPIASIPIMVRSKYCSLNIKKNYDNSECDYDPGGYFIVNGSEKVVISQERIIDNKPLIFIKKDSSSQMYVAQVNSRSPKINGMTQIITIQFKKNNQMNIRVPILNECPVMILFRALGVESDKDIIEHIVYDEDDIYMLNLVRLILGKSVDDKKKPIQTKNDAINYLSNKIRVIRRLTDADKEVRQQQKKMHLQHLLENNFLPHIEGGQIYKAYYLGYMINKLLNCFLGRTSPDDRDSYLNKRVDLVGNLIDDLFRQHFRKMLNECKKYFQKKNISDTQPINIINNIKPNTIEQGLKASLLTGSWGKKKGVAQVLQRLTYLQAIEMLRRVDSPSGEPSQSKLTGPRHLHTSQVGNLCCLTGDTEILLSDGMTTKKIKDFTNADTVLTINPNTLEKEESHIHSFFKKIPEKIIKITTFSGRTIKCSPEHPILVHTPKGHIWKTADELKLDDNVFIKYTGKYCDTDDYYGEGRGATPNIEYIKYKNYMTRNEHNIVTLNHNGIMNYDTFLQRYYIGGDMILNSIIKIEELPPEEVYDFTTISDNHDFVANGIIVKNCVETPEHAKVGLVKHLSLIGSITVGLPSQVFIIKDYLKKYIINLGDIQPSKIRDYTKIFLNGDWLGVTDQMKAVYKDLKNMKYNGSIDMMTSITYDDIMDELKIYCDGGRPFRPILRVKNNKIQLTKQHIDLISLDSTKKSETLITEWDEFLIKNPGIIEYIDSDEQAWSMLAESQYEVLNMEKIMNGSVEIIQKDPTFVDHLNRYGELTYVRYSHCEIHPSLLVGIIATNIPFCNHNQGPRNVFQYAQGRQAMCIYASNFRNRLDISYILYHPQKPLVNTRTSKYMYNDVLCPGENVVVAFSVYTGMNQEDSIVINKASIDRGMFRSSSYKKYQSIIQKNQATSQDDQFMKPDPTRVSGMRHGSYDKLNDKGYIPEETTIVDGDILIGKVTPMQPAPNNPKVFKDSSESYRSHIPGVVDKVFTDIYNADGYEMRKMRVRSERIPNIGDKFCCFSPDHDILTTDGWISIDNITLKHKVACLVDGSKLEYHSPTEIQSYDYDGDMYTVKSNQVNLMVTPNHRMYVGGRDKKNYCVMQAKTILHECKCYMKNCDKYIPNLNNVPNELKLKDDVITHFVLPKNNECDEYCVPINDWLMFYGMWITEGKCSTKWIIHFDVDKQLASYMKQYSVNAINKSLPNWVWYLSKYQCQTLISAMVLGNGHITENETDIYETFSKQLANDFQRLCLHAGYSSNMIVKYDTYCLTIIKSHNYPLVNKNIKLNGDGYHDNYVKYTGKVYCCTVPNDGIIYVRRNGYPVWCGNSRHG